MNCFKCLKKIEGSEKYGLHQKCYLTWFKLNEVLDFKCLELREEGKSSNETYKSWNSSFFHGNFKKYSALLGEDSYILKVKEDLYPELPEVEFLCNQIAEFLGIPIPEYYLISLFDERVFVTKNFCRNSNAKMTLNHIYKYLDEKAEFDCETLINIILRETGRYKDVLIFIQTCLYDSLIGNHDRHGRNLGLIVTSKGARLSPIYDNPSALGLESGSFLNMHWSPKGKVYTMQSKEPTVRDYVEEFIRLGHKDVVLEFIDKIDEMALIRIIGKSFCSSLMKSALKKLIEERIQEFYEYTNR